MFSPFDLVILPAMIDALAGSAGITPPFVITAMVAVVVISVFDDSLQ